MQNENERSLNNEEIENNLQYELEKALAESETDEEYKKIIRVALGKWLKNLQDGSIRLETVSDLKTLIEAERMLRE